MFIEAGADIDRRVAAGTTAIHDAATIEDTTLLEELVSSGAELSAVDDSSRTPLMIAAECNHWQNVKMLLDAGAVPRRIDRDFAPHGPVRVI